jgi:hypothetical protein
VGAIVARFGGLFLASPALDRDARLVLIDGDDYQADNAGRMLFRSCGNKAAVLRDEMLEYLADSHLTILAIESYVTSSNIRRLLQDGDIVILAVDNHRTRKLVSDYCASNLDNVCVISAGNDPAGQDNSGRVLRGTYGNCQVFIRENGQHVTPSLTQWHPEIDQPADQIPTEQSCAEMISSVPQILFANLMAASCALDALYRYLCGGPNFSEVAFDILDARMQPVPLLAQCPMPVSAPPPSIGVEGG